MKHAYLCALVLLAFSISVVGAGLPLSVFVVHCEPTNASDAMWMKLVDLVELADRYEIPLSIDLTAQWADMILQDEDKLVALEAWLATGHEIGCHHHPYWSTLGRPARWDGYTNTPFSELLPQDQAKHLGTMDDYMALLTALPGERTSGCLKGNDERDLADWPCDLLYSTHGHAVDDAASQPMRLAIGDCEILEIGHALIASAKRGELRAAYEATDADRIFGVVGHVYNYRDFPMVFEDWFAFLQGRDPEAEFRGTVSNLLTVCK
jgi:hypothetical protein